MPSAWVEHIRDFAKRNNMTYACALSDPKCSQEYRIKNPKPAKKGKKGKKLDLSKTEFTPLEEAEIDTEPKTKMIVEKKPPTQPAPTVLERPKKKTKTTPEPAPAAVRDWVFKPTKNNYGSTEVERAYMLNALPNDRKIAREGLYKNDRAEDFTVSDFKDAIDKNKKPETSVLLRIAKYLQKNEFGKIVYSKVAAKAPEPKAKGSGVLSFLTGKPHSVADWKKLFERAYIILSDLSKNGSISSNADNLLNVINDERGADVVKNIKKKEGKIAWYEKKIEDIRQVVTPDVFDRLFEPNPSKKDPTEILGRELPTVDRQSEFVNPVKQMGRGVKLTRDMVMEMVGKGLKG